MEAVMDFLKKELNCFSKRELILFSIILLLIFLLSVTYKDNPIATCSALFGLMYTILAGKGKISCYYLGMIGTLCYSYLALKNSLYGNLLLYFGYYFPMEIIGIFSWRKHLKADKKEIQKAFLKNNERIIFLAIAIILSLIVGSVFSYTGDKYPFLDSFVTVFSVLGMFLTVRRCIEQWIIWTVVNSLSIVIWFLIFINGGKSFATLLMWLVYLFLGIYFMYEWYSELKAKSIST